MTPPGDAPALIQTTPTKHLNNQGNSKADPHPRNLKKDSPAGRFCIWSKYTDACSKCTIDPGTIVQIENSRLPEEPLKLIDG
jgi:hypothetical protein